MTMDPKYQRLYLEYSKSMRMFAIARQKRQLERKRLTDRRNTPPPVRRPVGSPASFRIEQSMPPHVMPTVQSRPDRKVYLGETLGWAIISSSMPFANRVAVEDQEIEMDIDRLFEKTSINLFRNVRSHYLKSKRAFFDYVQRDNYLDKVRRENIVEHQQRARQGLAHIANLQQLGVGHNDAEFISLKREIGAACQYALALYRNAPKPTSDAMKIILLENLADAMLVGLIEEGNATARAMTDEMNLLINTNAVKIVKTS